MKWILLNWWKFQSNHLGKFMEEPTKNAKHSLITKYTLDIKWEKHFSFLVALLGEVSVLAREVVARLPPHLWEMYPVRMPSLEDAKSRVEPNLNIRQPRLPVLGQLYAPLRHVQVLALHHLGRAGIQNWKQEVVSVISNLKRYNLEDIARFL